MSAAKLSRRQLQVLVHAAGFYSVRATRFNGSDFGTTRSVAFALVGKGLMEAGFSEGKRSWRITEAGRKALADNGGKDAAR